MDVDQVLPKLFVGSCPTSPADVDRLKRDFAVTAVLNVQTEEDFQYIGLDWPELEDCYRRSGIEVRRVPVRDFDHEDLRRHLPACVDVLRELIEQGHAVYVHCNMGMGRSPSVVIAYLHWVGQQDLDEAFGHVSRCRPCVPDLEAIRRAGEDRLRG